MVGGSFYFLNSTARMKPFHGVQCGEETEQVAAGKMATRAGRCVGPWGGAGSCGENFLCTIVFSIIFLFLYNEEIMFENLKPYPKNHTRNEKKNRGINTRFCSVIRLASVFSSPHSFLTKRKG